MASSLSSSWVLFLFIFQVPSTEPNVVNTPWVLIKELWTQEELLIGWAPQKTDSEMKMGRQKVYWDVLGTHTCESGGEVGLGRRRSWTAVQSLQGVLQLISHLYTPSSTSLCRRASPGYQHCQQLGEGVLQRWTGDLQHLAQNRQWSAGI